MSDSRLPVWNGDVNALPPVGKFLYKGTEYNWRICDCGCKRPLGFIGEKHDFGMTVRMRGTNQGDILASVLVKLGKTEELIAAGPDRDAAAGLLNDTLGEMQLMPDRPDYDEVLTSKGIEVMEMDAAILEALGLPPEIAALF